MAQKITDVNLPQSTAPSPSSRPLIVTNRSTVTDPMVKEKAEAEPAEAIASHTIKTIQPSAEFATVADKVESPTTKPEEDDATQDIEETGEVVDAETEKKNQAEAAAEKARAEEISTVIASRKYALPIREASQGTSFWSGVLIAIAAIVLVLLVLDGLMDAGLIHIGNLKPITDFFQDAAK